MKYIKEIILLITLCIPSNLFAQEKLSLEQAIEIGLKNNYSIQISKNQSLIAANEVYPGNAGMLPQVNLNAAQNNSIVDSKQIFASGQEQNRKNAKSSSLIAGAALNWTLFDGMGMFATYERLKQLSDMGELNAKITIEGAVENIINTYYSVVLQKQMLRVILQSMDISQERIRISETKFQIGVDSKLAFLQAKVDFNADKSAFMKQKTTMENGEISLNELLGRDPNVKFDVTDSILISYHPSIDDLKKNLQQNVSLQQADKSILISKLGMKEILAQQYPRIGLNAGYNFSQSQSQSGFQLSNQTIGPYVGFTATMNLFNGFQLDRTYKSSQLSFQNSKLNYSMVKNQLDASVSKAYNDFNNKMDLLDLEKENLKVAQENIDAVMERYRLGNISALDVKAAQLSFSEANNRLVTALYDAKTAETTLMRLSGNLVK